MPDVSPTPQPYRSNNPGREYPRYNYETELWDSISCVVYYANDTSLTVPIPVDGVYDIVVTADLDTAGGTVTLSFDAVAQFIVYTAPGVGTLSFNTVIPAAKGTHNITIFATGATMTNPQIRVRRGRAG